MYNCSHNACIGGWSDAKNLKKIGDVCQTKQSMFRVIKKLQPSKKEQKPKKHLLIPYFQKI